MNNHGKSNDEWSPESLYLDEETAEHDCAMTSRDRMALSGGVSTDLIKSLAKNSAEPVAKRSLLKPRFTFESISLEGNREQMEKQMLKDVFVLDGVALLGQSTVIYGSSNFGKTLIVLWLIIEAAKNKNFEPGNLMYVNADDTHKGLTQKLGFAERYGFHMTAPGYNDFRAKDLIQMLRDFVLFDEANGKIIILDTLKKFTDLMDKKVGSEFGTVAREFTARGGTLISLAHVNKHKNSDGQSIMAGTSDISDDADCVFIGDVVSDSNEKIVELRNTKDRGNVRKKISFSYDQTEKDYRALLGSVKRIDTDEALKIRKTSDSARFMKENMPIINYIKELIYSGVNSQKEILNMVNEMHSHSQKKTRAILTSFTGNDSDAGKLWTYSSTEKNRYLYRLLSAYEI